MVEIRDGQGKLYRTIQNPAIVYDSDTYTLFKIGEANEVKDYYDKMLSELYTDGGRTAMEFVDSVKYMELPENQGLVDKIFNITGYLQKFIESLDT